ncbi:MAG: hypothetical protein KDK71_04580 [Chlamydiia bacterium]|nr:hypothetical protein [Chlamydiia bacterium]
MGEKQAVSAQAPSSSENVFALIVEVSAELQNAQLNNQEENANTTEFQATKLNSFYEYANTSLQKIISGITKNSSSTQIQEITAQYNLESSKDSNYESVISSNVQAQETQTQGIAQDQKMTVEFALDANGVETYTGNLLASSM